MIKQSISVKFTFLILLISLTPLLTLASYSYLEKTKTETAHIRTTLEREAWAGANQIHNSLTEQISTAQSIALMPSFVNAINAALTRPADTDNNTTLLEIEEHILPPLNANPALLDAYIRATNGSIIYSSTKNPPLRTLAKETSFTLALRGIASHSDIIPSAEPLPNEKGIYEIGAPTLFISTPLSKEQKIIATLTFRIDAARITRPGPTDLRNIHTRENYLINSEGYIISENKNASETRAKKIGKTRSEFEIRAIDPLTNNLTAVASQAIANGSSINIKGYLDYRNVLVVGAARKVPQTDWVYIVKMDKSAAYEGITRLQKFLFFQIVLSIILIFCISLFAGRYITQPILALLRAAEELKRGKFGYRTHIQTHDELQDLSLAFNRAAQQLGKTEAQRKQIDSAKTRFLSITSHELRSPMTPMRAQLQMLSRGYFGKLKPKQRASVQTVLRNANRLDTILKDFLDISRIEAGRLKLNIKKTDLAKLISETAQLNENYMPEKKIKITTNVPRLPLIQTDPDRITQVISNLITNAVKFSPQKSTITIGAQPLAKDILINVKDQGIGISPKDQQKLFAPFSQVEQTLAREYRGTGLGLAISKGILFALGGRIWIESKLGKGTTFYFTVPKKAPIPDTAVHSIFSTNESDSQPLERAFLDTLGSRGERTLALLKKEGRSSTSDLLNYVKEEQRAGKITRAQASELTKKIKELSH